MPVTPQFTTSQDDEFVLIEIHVPYVRVSDMDFSVDGTSFSFYCKPYNLKLNLPYNVVEDERAKATYDMNKNNGTIVCYLPKEIPKQHFPDLDLITKLLTKTSPSSVSLIQNK